MADSSVDQQLPSRMSQFTSNRRMTKRKIDSSELQFLFTNTTTSPKLQDILFFMSKRTVVKAKIPECLMQRAEYTTPVLLYSEKDIVNVSHGTHTFNKFFELVDATLADPKLREKVQQVPIYMIDGANRTMSFCMTKEDCISKCSLNFDGKYTIKRFIRSKTQKPVVYRVTYALNTGLSIYMIKNKQRQDLLRNSTVLKREGIQIKQVSIYQHSITQFLYAGKLLKASFSPYLPYRSLLSSRVPKSKSSLELNSRTSATTRATPKSQTSRRSHMAFQRKMSIESSLKDLQYIVDTRNMKQCKIFHVEESIPDLESLVMSFISSLERAYKGKTVAGLILDYVNSMDGSWVMIGCLELNVSDSRKEQKQVDDIKKKFSYLENLHLDTITDIRHLSLSQPCSPSALVFKSPKTPFPLVRPFKQEEGLIKEQLSVVQAKYDDLLMKARNSKKQGCDLATELAAVHNNVHFGEQLIESALVKVAQRDDIKTASQMAGKKELESGKEILFEVLRGDFKNLLKITKAGLFRKLGVSQLQYDSLVQIVIKEAETLHTPAHLVLQLSERLNCFT